MPKSKGPPSETTLKARRRRGVIFQDEAIQWHLNTSKHDVCPWCGLGQISYLSKTERFCLNPACDLSLTLTKQFSAREFFRAKINGTRGNYSRVTRDLLLGGTLGKETYSLEQAQKMSRNGRAHLYFFCNDGSRYVVWWHRDGHLPEDRNGKRVMAAGSSFWYWLMDQKDKPAWVPDESFTPLEVIAKAGTDDPVFMVTSY